MKVREQVVAVGNFPIALWEDTAARESSCWDSLRNRCAGIAAGRGYVLVPDAGDDRTVIYMRIVDTGTGVPIDVETTMGQAQHVRLRLATWAEPVK